MKTICDKCKLPNDLGRLFCTHCGAKLDLTNITDDLQREQTIIRRKGFFKLLLTGILILAALTAALVAIPAHPLSKIRAPDARTAATVKVLAGLDALAASSSSPPRAIDPPLTADDLNAWLVGPPTKTSGVRSMSVEFEQDAMRFRIVDALGPFTAFNGKAHIPAMPYSYELTGAATNGVFSVTGAKVGHFPLFGPLRRYAVDRIVLALQRQPREWKLLKSLTNIRFEPGRVSATVTPGQA